MSKRKAGHENMPHTRNFSIRAQMGAAPYGSEAIKVIVGSGGKRQTFHIHTALLVKHSDFFRAALRDDWKEATDRVVELKEDTNPEHFDIFKNFLYGGRIYSMRNDDSIEADSDAKGQDKEFRRLTHCWILGERLLSTSFKDAVTDAFKAKSVEERRSPTSAHLLIYPASSAVSPIRNLLVDFAVWEWDPSAFKKAGRTGIGRDADRDFMVDVATAFCELRNEGPSRLRLEHSPKCYKDSCRYHEHISEGKACYTTLF